MTKNGRGRKFLGNRELVCPQCGKLFSVRATVADADRKYCSRQCQHASIRELAERQCLYCKQTFKPRRAVQDYCSKRCGRLGNVKPATLTQKTMLRVCECGILFVKRSGKSRCAACQEKRTRIKEHMAGYARRAVTALYVAERIDPLEIAERDGWHCGLCGEWVQPGLKWPNPDALSLDHILPIAKGGKHTENNVQLAHLKCNWSKGKGRAKWRDVVDALVDGSN